MEITSRRNRVPFQMAPTWNLHLCGSHGYFIELGYELYITAVFMLDRTIMVDSK
jgi:hypothetical protein